MLPQSEKSQSHKNAQPKHDRGIIQLIIAHDLCGWSRGKIADEVDLTPSRISVIMNSPLYLAQRAERKKEFVSTVIDKKATEIVAGDPVENRIKELATTAIETKAFLLENAGSDFVKNSVASDILDRAGYRPEVKRTVTSIEVTEKMADRFERVLGYGNDNVKSKIKVIHEK